MNIAKGTIVALPGVGMVMLQGSVDCSPWPSADEQLPCRAIVAGSVCGYRVYSRNAVGLEKCVNFEANSAADAVTQAEISDRGAFPKWRVFGVEPMS